MSRPLIFYDTPAELRDGEDASQLAMSPNAWRARYVLNIKGVDYRTEWVDISDVGERMRKLGASPTKISNGEPVYTVPALAISETEVISDSQAIIQYLETTYPSPSLFPPGTRALQAAFVDTHYISLFYGCLPLIVVQSFMLNSERGKAHYRRTQAPMLGGVPIEEIELKGEARAEAIGGIIRQLGEIDVAIGDGGLFVAGDANAPSNADVNIAAILTWIRRVNGVEGDLWKAIMGAHGGRWERFMMAFERFQQVI